MHVCAECSSTEVNEDFASEDDKPNELTIECECEECGALWLETYTRIRVHKA